MTTRRPTMFMLFSFVFVLGVCFWWAGRAQQRANERAQLILFELYRQSLADGSLMELTDDEAAMLRTLRDIYDLEEAR
jgi:hypothetical protein